MPKPDTPNLRSVSPLEVYAKRVLDRFATWHESSARTLERTNASVVEIESLTPDISSLVNAANEIASDPQFATLTPNLRLDILDIRDELMAAEAEIREAVAPDSIFSTLDEPMKRLLVQGVGVDRRKVDLLRSRLRLERSSRRAQPGVIEDPDSLPVFKEEVPIRRPEENVPHDEKTKP